MSVSTSIRSVSMMAALHRQLPVAVKVALVNEHLICRLCGGYIVEATAVVECLHTCELLFNLFAIRAFSWFRSALRRDVSTICLHPCHPLWPSRCGLDMCESLSGTPPVDWALAVLDSLQMPSCQLHSAMSDNGRSSTLTV